MLRSIFWKFFLAIWLTNAAIVLSSAFSISYLADREDFLKTMRKKATSQAQKIIDSTEQGLTYRPKADGSPREPLPLQVRNPQGERIYGPAQLPPGERLRWTLSSKGGAHYRVTLALPPTREGRKVIAHFRHINIGLTLLITGLASGLLTYTIVRPMNRLRQFSQRLASGALHTRPDEALLSRNDEIGQLAKSLNHMAANIQLLLDSKQQLLHDVSHELRAPLARLQVAAELAQDAQGDNKLRYTDRIHREIATLERLIDDILALARLEQHTANAAEHDLVPILERSMGDFRFSFPDHPISLHIPHPCPCWQDPVLLQRAIDNLLGNAGKHTPIGTRIDLQATPEPDRIRLEIRDYGPGVAPELLDSLFDPFVRGNSTSRGYGLGLAIARRAILAQGGEISVTNAEGGGLRFRLYLLRSAPTHPVQGKTV